MNKLIALKLSGHLIRYGEVVRETLRELRSLSTIAKFILIPGGSLFADFVRELQGSIGFNDDIAHWLAIKAMEMYGAYIMGLDDLHILVETYDLAETREAISRGKIPVLMPYKIIKTLNELPHSWSVTSDSIAIYIAKLLEANMVILAKPVSGVLDEKSGLIRRMSITDLMRLNVNIIDSYSIELLRKAKIPLAIYNMLKPHLLKHIVNEESGDYTFIHTSF